MSAAPILAVEGLTAFYGRAQILFDVALTLRPGEVTALIGRNGAGKTTTLKAVMGLVTARARRLDFAGTSLIGLPSFRIARLGLGYVPEERRIFTDLTVFENLEVGRRPAPAGAEPWTPERLFAIFPNLAEMRRRRASEMSGGEQQMLTIARTLMGNPRAVLLDEPSEGLAPVIVELMGRAVVAMKAEGIAVLLSEQNLAFASAVGDRAYVIDRGHIRHEGSLAALAADEALRDAYLTVGAVRACARSAGGPRPRAGPTRDRTHLRVPDRRGAAGRSPRASRRRRRAGS
jgi:branched-chain amino acid transport system ATP-binding protein